MMVSDVVRVDLDKIEAQVEMEEVAEVVGMVKVVGVELNKAEAQVEVKEVVRVVEQTT